MWAWKCALLLIFAVHCCSANQPTTSVNAPRAPKPLDVSIPLKKLGTRLSALFNDDGFVVDINVVISAIMGITTCLNVSISIPPIGTSSCSPRHLAIPHDFSNDRKIKLPPYLMDFTNALPKENITAWCNSDKFAVIHNFTWVDDVQFREYLNFLVRFGYPDVYDYMRAFYIDNECREGLVNDVKPISAAEIQASLSSQSQYSTSNIRSQVHLSPSLDSILQLADTCNITAIITDLLDSGLLELLQFVETTLEQVNAEPSLHFLIGKIQEPIKGRSFRNFRLLDPVRDMFELVHQAILKDENIMKILLLVETFTGLCLKDINLIETILNIVEGLLWQNFSPVPPRS